MASVSISCPSCSATDGVVRNGKSTAGHQRYLCSHCRKTWQLQFTYTASQPGTQQKIIDMAMNGVGCRATARIMGVGLNTIFRHLKTQAAVGMKWFTEFGHLNRGDMLTSEQHRCHNEKRNFSAEFKRESAQLVVDQNYTVADAASAMDVGLSTMTRWVK